MSTSFEASARRHPFWTEVMLISGSDNRVLREISRRDHATKERFLEIVARGFDAFSTTSPRAYYRVSKLSEDPEARNVARRLHEVELGKHPLLADASYRDVEHNELFRRMIESLLPGSRISLAPASEYETNERLRLESASLTTALAACDAIEHIGSDVVRYLQDFIIQWQFITRLPSSLVDRTFIDEHSLTEGDASPMQHVGMLEKIVGRHAAVTRTSQYAAAKESYFAALVAALDAAYGRLSELIAHVNATSAPQYQ